MQLTTLYYIPHYTLSIIHPIIHLIIHSLLYTLFYTSLYNPFYTSLYTLYSHLLSILSLLFIIIHQEPSVLYCPSRTFTFLLNFQFWTFSTFMRLISILNLFFSPFIKSDIFILSLNIHFNNLFSPVLYVVKRVLICLVINNPTHKDKWGC